MHWWEEISARLTPAVPGAAATDLSRAMVTAVLIGVVIAIVPRAWRLARMGVTLVHELGHALVGVLTGRRFTGFVVRGDASGHAVTVGPERGLGRVLTTWAGYPAPGIVGALMVWAASRGYAAPLLAIVLVTLLVAVPRIRSLGTGAVTVIAGALTGALWWWGPPDRQAQLVTVAGVLLIVGAWRHLGAVTLPDRRRGAGRGRDLTSDPAVLARLTGLPRFGWVLSFALVLGVSTWVAALLLLGG